MTWLLSFRFTLLLSLVGFVLHSLGPHAPYAGVALIESGLLLQLLAAWRARAGGFPWLQGYALFVLFGYRLVALPFVDQSALWGLRAVQLPHPALSLLYYAVGATALHPTVYSWLRERINCLPHFNRPRRWGLILGGLAAAALLFSLLPSSHITRDGVDWVKRAANPVWHLYLREPLIIGLHRAAYLLASETFGWSARQALAALAVLSGVWCLFWFGRHAGLALHEGFRQMLAFLLFFASGGVIILFFGHLEVYPVLAAGWLPLFYFAQRYMQQEGRIGPVAVVLAIAFWLHLSTGWLLPAFMLLPFLFRPWWQAVNDWLKAAGLFILLQALFWCGMIGYGYEGSVLAFFERLHETFFVGLDRAMFLPASLWFHPGRLHDLMSEYVYLSLPCMLLLPLACYTAITRCNRFIAFYGLAAVGYFAYTFFWNPDRGFPEDWDLFSPWGLLLVLFIVHTLLREEFEHSPTLESVFLIVLGTLPFSVAQIYYHAAVPFLLSG